MDKSAYLSKMGARIRQRREELGITQEDLAFSVGYKSRASINKIELGKTDIGQTMIIDIAETLHIPTNYITDVDTPVNDILNRKLPRLLPDEQQLLSDYRNFNEEGQEKVRDYIADLKDNQRYKNVVNLAWKNKHK